MKFRTVDKLQTSLDATTSHMGRRGIILFLLGIIWIFQGVSVLATPPNQAYFLLDNYEPFRALGWVVTGLMAIRYSLKPQGADAYGYVSLYIMAAYRIMAYMLGFFNWVIPGGSYGHPRGAVGLFTWTVILILLVIVAGWKEPEEEL